MSELDETKCEIICPKCKGYKKIFYCSKCKGTGKVDWIENIVGKKEDDDISLYTTTANINGPYTITNSLYSESYDIKEFIRREVAEQLSKEIDKRLLEEFSNIKEQKLNIKGVE